MTKKRPAHSSHHKAHSSGHVRTKKDYEIEHALLQNIIELQKVHASQAEKFDHLSKEISNLLALFEITARNFAKNAPQTADYQKDKDFLEKIDRLLDQNKLLAKGLSIMEERLKERMFSPQPQVQRPNAPPQKEIKPEEENFQQSMASRNRPLPKF